ncbi:MAG: A/G-specific adenine glycosylase [Hyphomicrobiaceae bacterium]|nr:A/G-specific adenine glycosylase [Hyphomicrobiaceae bacterium]
MTAVAQKHRPKPTGASVQGKRTSAPKPTGRATQGATVAEQPTVKRPSGKSDAPVQPRVSPAATPLSIAEPLLAWYDRERRHLPWRYGPDVIADPYRVWLSEIMLQQTTVKAVVPFFQRFVERWPTVDALAAAPENDVLAAWAGLGYYSRARNLHACARAVAARPNGDFPRFEHELVELPGIGPYTAAAISAIAFGERASPVDGNIERITSRLFAHTAPLPAAKPELRRLSATLTPDARPGDFAQALMDLGARICTPKRPSCLMCPLKQACEARALGIAEELPARAAKPERPIRRGVAFLVLSEDGLVLLRRRQPRGLLASMMEVPSTDWVEARTARRKALEAAPVTADWYPVTGLVEHTFTHFKLEIEVLRAVVPADTSLTLWAEPERCSWVARGKLKSEALPSVMRKIIAHGLKGE